MTGDWGFGVMGFPKCPELPQFAERGRASEGETREEAQSLRASERLGFAGLGVLAAAQATSGGRGCRPWGGRLGLGDPACSDLRGTSWAHQLNWARVGDLPLSRDSGAWQ